MFDARAASQFFRLSETELSSRFHSVVTIVPGERDRGIYLIRK
jgi:hypothetical protein